MIWSMQGRPVDGCYDILYPDPPWSYSDAGCNGAAEDHYPTASTADLAKLPIGALGSANSVMFMWATYPKLPDALELGAAWGYKYKSIAFQWVKTYKSGEPRFGLGRWTRGNTEPCLLFVRGKPSRVDNAVSQLIFSEELVVAEIGRHSEKPAIVREKIIRLMGDLPAIELFGRVATPGWDVWGNQVQTAVKLESQGA